MGEAHLAVPQWDRTWSRTNALRCVRSGSHCTNPEPLLGETNWLTPVVPLLGETNSEGRQIRAGRLSPDLFWQFREIGSVQFLTRGLQHPCTFLQLGVRI
jgi:hypothetical protein